jgi:hypothetical protein
MSVKGIEEKGLFFLREKKWMLHHSAPAHSTLLTHDFLAKLEIIIIPRPL